MVASQTQAVTTGIEHAQPAQQQKQQSPLHFHTRIRNISSPADEKRGAIAGAEDRGLVRRTRHSKDSELLDKVNKALHRDPYALRPAPPQL